MYSNNILNFQESTTILNACTKKYIKYNYKTRLSTKHWEEKFVFRSNDLFKNKIQLLTIRINILKKTFGIK